MVCIADLLAVPWRDGLYLGMGFTEDGNIAPYPMAFEKWTDPERTKIVEAKSETKVGTR
jgi:hypothetical protein